MDTFLLKPFNRPRRPASSKLSAEKRGQKNDGGADECNDIDAKFLGNQDRSCQTPNQQQHPLIQRRLEFETGYDGNTSNSTTINSSGGSCHEFLQAKKRFYRERFAGRKLGLSDLINSGTKPSLKDFRRRDTFSLDHSVSIKMGSAPSSPISSQMSEKVSPKKVNFPAYSASKRKKETKSATRFREEVEKARASYSSGDGPVLTEVILYTGSDKSISATPNPYCPNSFESKSYVKNEKDHLIAIFQRSPEDLVDNRTQSRDSVAFAASLQVDNSTVLSSLSEVPSTATVEVGLAISDRSGRIADVGARSQFYSDYREIGEQDFHLPMFPNFDFCWLLCVACCFKLTDLSHLDSRFLAVASLPLFHYVISASIYLSILTPPRYAKVAMLQSLLLAF